MYGAVEWGMLMMCWNQFIKSKDEESSHCAMHTRLHMPDNNPNEGRFRVIASGQTCHPRAWTRILTHMPEMTVSEPEKIPGQRCRYYLLRGGYFSMLGLHPFVCNYLISLLGGML